MSPDQLPTDPSMWQQHGLPGLVIFTLFALLGWGAHVMLKRSQEQEQRYTKLLGEQEQRHTDAMLNIEERHTKVSAEQEERHKEERDRHFNERQEWHGTISAMQTDSSTNTTKLTHVVDELRKAIEGLSRKTGTLDN